MLVPGVCLGATAARLGVARSRMGRHAARMRGGADVKRGQGWRMAHACRSKLAREPMQASQRGPRKPLMHWWSLPPVEGWGQGTMMFSPCSWAMRLSMRVCRMSRDSTHGRGALCGTKNVLLPFQNRAALARPPPARQPTRPLVSRPCPATATVAHPGQDPHQAGGPAHLELRRLLHRPGAAAGGGLKGGMLVCQAAGWKRHRGRQHVQCIG
jgi:hypothetical protein